MVHAPGGALVDIIAGLAGETMMRFVHTRDGAAVGCMVLAYGSPKDRKKGVKAMKGVFFSFSLSQRGRGGEGVVWGEVCVRGVRGCFV